MTKLTIEQSALFDGHGLAAPAALHLGPRVVGRQHPGGRLDSTYLQEWRRKGKDADRMQKAAAALLAEQHEEDNQRHRGNAATTLFKKRPAIQKASSSPSPAPAKGDKKRKASSSSSQDGKKKKKDKSKKEKTSKKKRAKSSSSSSSSTSIKKDAHKKDKKKQKKRDEPSASPSKNSHRPPEHSSDRSCVARGQSHCERDGPRRHGADQRHQRDRLLGCLSTYGCPRQPGGFSQLGHPRHGRRLRGALDAASGLARDNPKRPAGPRLTAPRPPSLLYLLNEGPICRGGADEGGAGWQALFAGVLANTALCFARFAETARLSDLVRYHCPVRVVQPLPCLP